MFGRNYMTSLLPPEVVKSEVKSFYLDISLCILNLGDEKNKRVHLHASRNWDKRVMLLAGFVKV